MNKKEFLKLVAQTAHEYADTVDEQEDAPWACSAEQRMADFALYLSEISKTGAAE